MTMHAHNLPRHPPILPKTDAEEFAADVVEWFGRCLRFLARDNWEFYINSSGRYLPGDFRDAEPENFEREVGGWSLKLRCRAGRVRTPCREEELTEARERIHKAVTIVVMNLTSSAKAGKMLAQLRQDHGLKKLFRSDIM